MLGAEGPLTLGQAGQGVAKEVAASSSELLLQVMEENRNLRLKLEMPDASLSWHSQGTSRTRVVRSPVSFAPGVGSLARTCT